MTKKDKIKICHFVNLITGRSDGVYSHLKMLFKYTDHTKYEQFLLFQGDAQIENEVRDLGIKIIRMESLKKKLPFKSFLDYFQVMKREKFDIIHVHLNKPYIIAGLSNIYLCKKVLYNYHGVFLNNEYYSVLEKLVYRIAHCFVYIFNGVQKVVVPSEGSRRTLLKESRLFPEIFVYHNGTENISEEQPNQDSFTNKILELKNGRYMIGIIARLEIQKNIKRALEIIRLVIDQNSQIQFIFIGDGPLEKEMKDLSAAMNLGENVTFFGFVPSAKKYIKYFDLILFSSDWEGFPLVIWETMSAGIPVVSTDVGGIKDVIEQEKCGIIYQKNELQNCSTTIIELLGNLEKRKKMGENGIKAIKDKYNVEKFRKQFEEIYSDLLNG